MRAIILLLGVLVICSCTRKNDEHRTDNALSGRFTVITDEAFYPMVKVLSETYMALYPEVVINIQKFSTPDPYQALVTGTARTLITSSVPGSRDSIMLLQNDKYIQLFHLFSDAVVLIGNKEQTRFYNNSKESPDLCPGRKLGVARMNMITDNSYSENTKFIRENLMGKLNCPDSLYASGDHEAIFSRISSSTGEIGAVGFSWTCETKNGETKKRRNGVQIIPVISNSGDTIHPNQSSIFLNEYPFSRKVYMVTSEPFAGPATGFAAFSASVEGQRIIRMFGAVPSKIPPREVSIQ